MRSGSSAGNRYPHIGIKVVAYHYGFRRVKRMLFQQLFKECCFRLLHPDIRGEEDVIEKFCKVKLLDLRCCENRLRIGQHKNVLAAVTQILKQLRDCRVQLHSVP